MAATIVFQGHDLLRLNHDAVYVADQLREAGDSGLAELDAFEGDHGQTRTVYVNRGQVLFVRNDD